uniref:nicotinate phosphoribosyltransferase n=1 Tax=Anopheles stephensi TaxID=30069 RepID=A0A182YS65_ANOST
MAGKLFNIPVKGTHAHAYITSFTGIDELKTRVLLHKEDGTTRDLLELAMEHRAAIASVLDVSTDESSEGELAAMVSFAIAFPDGFMALVDTYDVKSDKFPGEATEELCDPTDSVVCDPTCAGRLHDLEDEESLLAEDEATHGEETVDEEESDEVPVPDESCHDPPPSITVEDEECEPVEETELLVIAKESDENGNEDIEDQNVRKEADDEEAAELEAQNQTEAPEGEDEITRCANCEALNTMIHHLKSVGKSFR